MVSRWEKTTLFQNKGCSECVGCDLHGGFGPKPVLIAYETCFTLLSGMSKTAITHVMILTSFDMYCSVLVSGHFNKAKLIPCLYFFPITFVVSGYT